MGAIYEIIERGINILILGSIHKLSTGSKTHKSCSEIIKHIKNKKYLYHKQLVPGWP